jgi:hypothetical protein
MSLFTVSQSDAATFQEHYQRLVEAWLCLLVDKELPLGLQQDKEKSEIRVIDGNKVVYDSLGEEFNNELTPELIGKLEALQSTPVGGLVEEAGSKTIEVKGQVILQSDDTGKVVVNHFLKKQREPLSQALAESEDMLPTPPEEVAVGFYDEDWMLEPPEEDWTDDYYVNEQLVEPHPEAKTLAKLSGQDEVDDSSSNQQESQSQTSAPQREQKQTDSLGGLEAVRSSVQGMPDGSLKQMLASQLGEMQQSLQQHSARQQVLEDLVRQRLAQPKQTNWWQLFRETVTQAWATLKKRSLLDSAAAQMKTLFHAQVPPGGKVYQADNYTIVREGRSYTLNDKSGMGLMQFQSTPMGVRVSPQTVQMSSQHYQDIKQLSLAQSRGEEPSGGFAPVGQGESKYLLRVNAITKALGQYAQATGSKVQVDGKFAYKWLATPDGRVRIDAKDGRGPLLVQHQGQLRCRMSDRDLAHFEQMLPVLNSTRSSVSSAAPRQKVALDWERN